MFFAVLSTNFITLSKILFLQKMPKNDKFIKVLSELRWMNERMRVVSRENPQICKALLYQVGTSGKEQLFFRNLPMKNNLPSYLWSELQKTLGIQTVVAYWKRGCIHLRNFGPFYSVNLSDIICDLFIFEDL